LFVNVEKILLVVELCAKGSLDKYLENNRLKFEKSEELLKIGYKLDSPSNPSQLESDDTP